MGSIASKTASGIPYITSGLQAWWKFNEGSGTTASDSSGNSWTGALQATPTWTTGEYSDAGAITYNGTTQYIDVTSSTSLMDNPTALSVVVRFKTTVSLTGFTGQERSLVTKLDNNIQTGTGWYCCNSSDIVTNAFMVGIQNGGGNNFYQLHSTFAINDGAWHTGILLLDSSTPFISGYCDMSALSPSGDTGGSNPYGSISNAVNVRVANNNGQFNSVNQAWSGQVGEVRIYNRKISSTECTDITNDLG